MDLLPFTPHSAATNSISATAGSARVLLSEASSDQLELTNDGPNTVYLEFGGSSVAATVPNGGTGGGYPVLAGQSKVIQRSGTWTYAAAICATSQTALVLITAGKGD